MSHRKKHRPCRSVKSADAVDSHPAATGRATDKAESIVSKTYKLPSNGGRSAALTFKHGVQDPPRRKSRSLLPRSDILMPRDRLDRSTSSSLGSVSVIGQSETVSARRGIASCTGKNPTSIGPAAAVSGRTMMTTCASPACNVPFRYFRSGQIFMVEGKRCGL
jgi:hypothetical protein